MSATVKLSYGLFAVRIGIRLSSEEIERPCATLSAEKTVSLSGSIVACLGTDDHADHLVVLAAGLLERCRTSELSLILLVEKSVLFLVRIGKLLEEALADQLGNCEISAPAGLAYINQVYIPGPIQLGQGDYIVVLVVIPSAITFVVPDSSLKVFLQGTCAVRYDVNF